MGWKARRMAQRLPCCSRGPIQSAYGSEQGGGGRLEYRYDNGICTLQESLQGYDASGGKQSAAKCRQLSRTKA